jgi:hypothetical protein
MLYIRNSKVGVMHFHMGDKTDRWNISQHTTMVQADGQELQAIRTQLANLPNNNESVVCWYGDHAKFIVGNLKLG